MGLMVVNEAWEGAGGRQAGKQLSHLVPWMLRAGAVPLPCVKGTCSMNSLAVRELWPMVVCCGAKNDRDCVMAYNLSI